MENPLIFNYSSTLSDKIFRLITVLLSFIDIFFISANIIEFGINLGHVLSLIVLLMIIIFFFPRITYISSLQIKNGTVNIYKWYNNRFIRKFMSVKSNNMSFSLLPLEKLEIQHLGMVSKVGRINFLFNDQKKVGLTFTYTEITSQQVKNFKKYNPEIKIINAETINNLAILADYFSYGYDTSEFIQDDQKSTYFILIIILLVLLPILSYSNIFS
jgi:hypothetical protein